MPPTAVESISTSLLAASAAQLAGRFRGFSELLECDAGGTHIYLASSFWLF